MPSWWRRLNLWQNRLNDDQDDCENQPTRRDSTYEEVYRRSLGGSKSSSSHSLVRQLTSSNTQHTTETTVKLRKIGSGGRRVFVNLPLPSYDTKHITYVTNRIRTSKYTVFSFVPKNLFEQFRRPANLYFLVMAIIQLLPLFGVKSPALTLLPICSVVFITAVKDAIEDFQRHKVDEQYNQNITHTLLGYENVNYPQRESGGLLLSLLCGLGSSSSKRIAPKKESANAAADKTFQDKQQKQQINFIQQQQQDDTTEFHHPSCNNYQQQGGSDVFSKSLSKDVRVGDFILLRNGDSLPADAVLISTSDKEGVCFVETKDLDGETNLKPRTSIPELKHVQSGADCLNDCHFYIEANVPSPDLYKFSGTLVNLVPTIGKKWTEKSKTPVEIENILLRGHVVRNTKWAIAVVLFTGTDTKIMLNSGETPSKRSQVDKQMNKEIFVAFTVLFILCLICAIMAGVMRQRAINTGPSASLLFSSQTDSPAYAGFLNFWSSLIIFQNIIPISLYVSIEFVKTFQAYFIYNDLDMWDEQSKRRCIPKTWTLSDDLGQVEYIFSDKTGTLTRNIMEFRECTIDGKLYGDNGFAPESEGARGARLRKEKENTNTNRSEERDDHNASSSSARGTPELIDTNEDPLDNNEEKHDNEEHREKKLQIFKDYEASLKQVFQPKYSSLDPDRLSFADPEIFKDIRTADIDKDSQDNSFMVKEFFMCLALCHTVVIERIGKDGKPIDLDDEEEEGDENEGDNTTTKAEQQPKISEDPAKDKSISKPSKFFSNNKKKAISSYDQIEQAEDADSKEEKEHLSKKFNYKVRVGGAKLLKLSGLRHLKKQQHNKNRRKSRGEEFESITNEMNTPDKVDDTVEQQIDYKAESPDEAALVSAAKNAGFTFIKRKGNTLVVDILGQEYDFKLLSVLDFNSDRKRMSVILRRPAPWNDIILYCKGADNVIGERLKEDHHAELVDKTYKDIEVFSNNGLRTLMLTYRILQDEEFQQWKSEMDDASTASEGRAEKIAEVQEKIETNLELLGAAGIEDKLQDGVPQCIEDLRRAGIKVWVLTGDKLETAINIGYASNLLDGHMKLWTVRGSDDMDKVVQNLEEISRQLEQQQENALVIEGSALIHVFESNNAKEKLLEIAVRCKSVICCRVSPLQKALVVQLVRKYHNVVTLAIGDGANDVSMIQVANVGVGIAGQEGVQAAMAADYAIGQFRFLHKLLLVQGHWSYSRVSEMILTFFFKNIFWVFPSLWYQIYSAWSGNIFYDYSFLQLYNLIFTVAPVVIIGCTDQDLTAPYLKHLPPVYTIGIHHKLYTKSRFWLYFLDGVWQSLVVFYGFYFLWIGGNINPNGYPESILQLSTSVAVTAIVLANIMPGFNTYYWTWWQFVFVAVEILVTFIWVVVYGSFQSVSLYGMATMVFGSGLFWTTFLFCIVTAFLPRYLITFTYQWWFPNVVAKGRHLELYEKKIKKRKQREQQQDPTKGCFSSFWRK